MYTSVYIMCDHIRPVLMWEMVALQTPNRRASGMSVSPAANRDLISLTATDVRMLLACESPRAVVPWRSRSAAFSFGVPHARLNRLSFPAFPSRCLHCIPSGRGPTKASRTRAYTVTCRFLPLRIKATDRLPRRSVLGFRRCGVMPICAGPRPWLQYERTMPESLTA